MTIKEKKCYICLLPVKRNVLFILVFCFVIHPSDLKKAKLAGVCLESGPENFLFVTFVTFRRFIATGNLNKHHQLNIVSAENQLFLVTFPP